MFIMILVSVILSLSSSLVLADGIRLDQLPTEVIMEILRNSSLLELDQFRRVSKSCKEIVLDPKFKAEMIEKTKSVIEKKLASAEKLSLEEFNYLMKHSEKFREKILSKLHEHSNQLAKELIRVKKLNQTDSPQKTYVALFLAKYVIDSSAWNAARAAAWNVEGSADKASNANPAWSAAEDAGWSAAWDVAWKATWNAGWSASWSAAKDAAKDAAANATKRTAFNATKNFIAKHLDQLKLQKTPKEIDQKAFLLSELYTMSWFIQNDSEYFKNAFNAAYEKLDGAISIEKANEIINKHIGKKELVKNQFIIELKDFLIEAKELINKSVQNEEAMDWVISP